MQSKFKVIKCSNEYRAYSNECEVFDDLPPNAYKVCFHKMAGYWLEETKLQYFTGRIYGDSERRVKKVFKTYDSRPDRNLGVLLSGVKGTGKSITAKMIARSAIEDHKLPVIVVTKNVGGGLVDFLSSIKTKCVVMFDEFDKMFPKFNDDQSDGDEAIDAPGGSSCGGKMLQDAFLSFFDGVSDETHKIIVCTCNNIRNCSSFMINRPGRLFYHFRFTAPSRDVVQKYFDDNIAKEFSSEISQLVNISCAMQLSFDSMEALCFEINNGESVTNALEDLNIVNGYDNRHYLVTYIMSNGDRISEDLAVSSGRDCIVQWIRTRCSDGSYMNIRVKFFASDMKFDQETGGFTVNHAEIDGSDDDSKIKGIKINSVILAPKPSLFGSSNSIFELIGAH